MSDAEPNAYAPLLHLTWMCWVRQGREPSPHGSERSRKGRKDMLQKSLTHHLVLAVRKALTSYNLKVLKVRD